MGNTCISPDNSGSGHQQENAVDFLFVGNHYAGKTTLIKHLQVLYDVINPDHIKTLHKRLVQESITEHIKTFITVANDYKTEHPEVFEDSKDCLEHLNELDAVHSEPEEKYVEKKPKNNGLIGGPEHISHADADKLISLWDSGNLKTILDVIDIFPGDQLPYIFRAAVRCSQEGFCPTDLDILRCHWQTIGECSYDFPGLAESTVRMHDCSGHQHSRRKWGLYFKDCRFQIVFLVVALDSFCYKMNEDANINRMQDSLEVARIIMNSRNMKGRKKYIIFNKSDLFTDELLEQHEESFKNTFPNYEGEMSVEPALKFLKDEFLSILRHEDPDLEPKVIVMSATQDIDAEPPKSPLKLIFDKWVKQPEQRRRHGRNTSEKSHQAEQQQNSEGQSSENIVKEQQDTPEKTKDKIIDDGNEKEDENEDLGGEEDSGGKEDKNDNVIVEEDVEEIGKEKREREPSTDVDKFSEDGDTSDEGEEKERQHSSDDSEKKEDGPN